MNENPSRQWYKKWWGILTIIFLVFVLAFIFASALYVYDAVKNPQADTYNLEENNLSKNDLELITGSANNYFIGAKNPKITIVEFADFSCHYCGQSFPVIRELSLRYKDDIKVIYRDFPVVSGYSADLSLAARCAGEQGLFWMMHDKLFINQGVNSNDGLLSLAAQIGADTGRFKTCIDNKKYLTDIEKDFSDGQELGIKGTPTWFINGSKIEGNIPYDIFVQIIESIINK